MVTTIAVQKESATESNLSLIKRFSRRLQGANILRRAKAKRYAERPLSTYKKKKQILKKLERRAKVARLIKFGLLEDVRRHQPH